MSAWHLAQKPEGQWSTNLPCKTSATAKNGDALTSPVPKRVKKLLGYAEPGDTVVVWRIDRLGRSVIDVLDEVNLLRESDE